MGALVPELQESASAVIELREPILAAGECAHVGDPAPGVLGLDEAIQRGIDAFLPVDGPGDDRLPDGSVDRGSTHSGQDRARVLGVMPGRAVAPCVLQDLPGIVQ